MNEYEYPTFEELLEYASKDIKLKSIPEKYLAIFFDWYESNGWVVGNSGTSIKNWKAILHLWNKNNTFEKHLGGY